MPKIVTDWKHNIDTYISQNDLINNKKRHFQKRLLGAKLLKRINPVAIRNKSLLISAFKNSPLYVQ